jgi:diguanylate cyclase (GGDEF)-like protein
MKLHTRIDEMQRYGWPCGVLFLDIDNFKIVNDTYGHNVGDGVLMMVARTLANNLRAHDLVGRYGGEEFVAIITHVDMAQLHSFAERLRLLVENSSHDTEYGTIRVTVSIGATVVRPEDTIETAITRADMFMYNSKIGGRNRVSLDTMLDQNGQDLIRKGWSASGPVSERIAASRIQFQSLGKIEPAQLPKKRTPRKKS